MRRSLQMHITLMSGLSTVCNIDITPPTAPTIAHALVVPESPHHNKWDGSSNHWNTATTHQCWHHLSPIIHCQHPARGPILTNVTDRYDCNWPQLVNISTISNGEESSSQIKVSSLFRWQMAEYWSGVEGVNVMQMHVWWRETCGVGKASWFGEPSGSVIKPDLLSLRILAQVEVKASRLCSISVKSFNFTLCPISAVTSIACSSRTVPTPTLPEPPGTFSSSTTSESSHDLSSVRICIQQSNCGTKSPKTQWSAPKVDYCSRSECSCSQDMDRDSNGRYQPPYSLHVQEMRVCGQCSWGTHNVLTRKAPSDACDAICPSGNYEETFSSLWSVWWSKRLSFSDDSTRVFVHLKNKHTDT